MKKFVKSMSKIAAVGIASILTMGFFAACEDTDPGDKASEDQKPAPIVNAPTITVTPDKDEFKKGETITLDVDVSDNGNYNVSVDNTCVSVNGNVLTMTGDIEIDKWITITVSHDQYPSVVGTANVTAKAPVVAGKVGELTSEMLQEAGNASVTVSGKLTDVYEVNGGDTKQTKYEMSVKMEDGKWQGSWYAEGHAKNVNVSTYAKGTETAVGENKDSGHVMLEKYIDKDNKVAAKPITNYMSFPMIWESQHLWNHIGSLNVNKFTYDAKNEVYQYNIDHTPTTGELFSADEWLMTYLSYSMTPLLEDTLDELYLKVEGGKVTRMLGSTQKLYDGGQGNSDDYETLSYTLVDLTFSDVGETTVADPVPYTEPQDAQQKIYFDKLQEALTNMHGAKNYMFFATNTTTYKPVTDPGDYETESASATANASTYAKSTYASSASGGTSSTGTVGQKGFVTENAVVLATTGKYDYALDENLYYTSYSGYKKIDDTTYDAFSYNSTSQKLTGDRQYKGSLGDRIPSFDFSPYVFEFKAMSYSSETESYTYSFVLRDSAITRDVAMQVSMYSYASSASASATERFTIVVDDKGHVLSTTYPYSVNLGSYLGYVNTVYSDVGTTVISDTVFGVDDADYVPRVIPSTWGDLEMKGYYVLDGSQNESGVPQYVPYGNAEKYMNEHYTEAERAKLPPIGAFYEIFGDYVSGVFEQDNTVSDSQGGESKVYYWSLTAETEKVDEHMHVLQEAYEELVAKATEVLAKYGFTHDLANSNDTMKQGEGTTRYACFSNDTFKIVIENNFTKNFWIYCHKAGDWQLKR